MHTGQTAHLHTDRANLRGLAPIRADALIEDALAGNRFHRGLKSIAEMTLGDFASLDTRGKVALDFVFDCFYGLLERMFTAGGDERGIELFAGKLGHFGLEFSAWQRNRIIGCLLFTHLAA